MGRDQPDLNRLSTNNSRRGPENYWAPRVSLSGPEVEVEDGPAGRDPALSTTTAAGGCLHLLCSVAADQDWSGPETDIKNENHNTSLQNQVSGFSSLSKYQTLKVYFSLEYDIKSQGSPTNFWLNISLFKIFDNWRTLRGSPAVLKDFTTWKIFQLIYLYMKYELVNKLKKYFLCFVS